MISQNGKLKREKWHEWFRVEIEIGYAVRFYFPVEKLYPKGSTVCWIWYLVPFVLFARMFAIFAKSIYLDTRSLLDEWKMYRNAVAFPMVSIQPDVNTLVTKEYMDNLSFGVQTKATGDGVGLTYIEHPKIKSKSILSRFLVYFVRPKFSEESLEKVSQCNCYKMLGLPQSKVFVHLSGCEEHEATKEYDKLVWWKKLFTKNPRKNRLFDKA